MQGLFFSCGMIVVMNEMMICLVLGFLGAAMGSFAGAQVWRLRARQLVDDKKAGEPYDKAEYARLKPLMGKKGPADRSIDLDTGKQLQWYDMIPIISWLVLRGRSRYSGKFIGWFEFVMEVGVATFFVLSYVYWPYALDSPWLIGQFVVWLITGVVMAIQFGYDFKWQLLWTWLSVLVIILGAVYAGLGMVIAEDLWSALLSVVGSVVILGGLYFILWWLSRERWVGLGDVILGTGLGLLLADWRLAFVALIAANLVGTIIVVVGAVFGKVSRGQHIAFGPLLIIGAIIAQLWGRIIIDWYTGFFLP